MKRRLLNQRYLQQIWVLFLFIGALLTSNTSCSTVPLRERADSLFHIIDNVQVYYDLEDPDNKIFVPYALSEISGIARITENTFLCIEDESGKVYTLHIDSAKITSSTIFSRPKDFEDIEVVNGIVYVLESDGDIYEFPMTEDDTAKVTRYETPLKRDNDTEGLGFQSIHWQVDDCMQGR